MSTLIKTDLKDFTLQELNTFVKGLDEPAFRAKQIFSWLYRPNIRSFAQMTDVSKKFREKMEGLAFISQLELQAKEVSEDETIKYAFTLDDGNVIESVLIPDDERYTLCVSSQVGCAMGCKFCLTATMGFKRNLTAAEIVNQVYYAIEDLSDDDKHVHNLVFMGMGEPLANFDNLIRSLKILQDECGLNFSDRRITVSTCGLTKKIIELGQQSKVNLAISLHAADDQTRNSLMPVNETHSIDDLLAVCRQFPLPKRRRIMIEYILLRGINDSEQDARKLIKKLHKLPCKINLLPYNENEGLPYKRPTPAAIFKFQDILHKAGHTVMVRQSRGADISAACGQLASKSK